MLVKSISMNNLSSLFLFSLYKSSFPNFVTNPNSNLKSLNEFGMDNFSFLFSYFLRHDFTILTT